MCKLFERKDSEVAGFVHYKMTQKTWEITETLGHMYSFENTQRELSNEY